ncbi:multiple sugar transport system permease protein [Microbacterium trichothecenolyticum]|uniref:carbohydrate ABC transporter permease n=1 Tax=Microbacterium trichothecenolyticum TaxID=69370 RepID=UPI0028667BF4|nr:carbohydrate ABC transporter permease [Microbacterium trichothecenolyticum]MDR7184426.1 multiple sugar transport system permease protein [Microbacterium trichothecenolyticum]
MTSVTTTVRAITRRSGEQDESEERSNISALDRSRRTVRIATRVLTVVLIAGLVVVAFGPLLWLFKAALSTSQDILKYPFEWWPSGIQWQNLPDAWSQIRIGQYLLNTVWMAAGCWFFGLLVALTGGYGIAILRPKYAKAVNAAVLATLFIPGVVSLISLYVTILDVPLIGVNLVNTFWAVWLPTAASAFNVLLVARFFDRLPRDVFEAARIDGAGVFRVFWSIVLPMSRPVIGVVSLLTIVGSWKEFLWPLLVLPSPDLQPLSVGLYRISDTAPTSLLMAGMFISVIIPIGLFLLFQRQFLRSAGQAGAIKG